jgi:hypothetical protein
MSMDDPGWGDFVPQSEAQTESGPAGGGRDAGVGQQGDAVRRPDLDEMPRQDGSGSGRLPQLDKLLPWVSKNRKLVAGGGVVLLVVIIILVATGGGGGSLTKSQYIAKADAICSNFSASLDAASSSDNSTELVSLLQSEIGQLKALGLPSQDPQTISSWLSVSDSAVTALQQGNISVYDADANQSDSLASSYGMSSCS